MDTSGFSNILLSKSPKDINSISEDIINTLFKINEVVRELNSVDFCNPLGYILTKSLPPGGIVESKLKSFSNQISSFINKSTQLELNNNSDIIELIEEIRLSLEDIIPDEELKNIIPGGDAILKTIQSLNDSLVITNVLLNPQQKKQLIKSFTNRLIPFTNPSSLAEVLIGSQVQELNKKLSNIIKPERFREDLLSIIKLVNKIDKSIFRIQNIINLMDKIIKSINVLIKITKLIIKILKKTPTPAKYVTVGSAVTKSSKVASQERQLDELSKLLTTVSNVLNTSILKQIKRIRREIFILLIGLNQLYENISSCESFKDDILNSELKNSINKLQASISILDEIFPDLEDDNKNDKNKYKGYNIVIVKEDPTDNNIKLLRRRVIVTNNKDIIEYEGTPTYSNKDNVLIMEGRFYIDSKDMVEPTKGNSDISDEDVSILVQQTGLPYTLDEVIELENKTNEILYGQIQDSPTDKKLYNELSFKNELGLNQQNIEKIKKIANSINYTNYNLFQIRLKKLTDNLLKRGYKIEEISQAYKYLYEDKYNIIIVGNNISINKK